MALPKVSQTELAEQLAEETGTSRSDAKRFLEALSNIVSDNLKECVRTEVAGVIIAPALKAATKKRMGRNPSTGEDVQIAAKPASVRISLKASKKLKEKAPSVKKLNASL